MFIERLEALCGLQPFGGFREAVSSSSTKCSIQNLLGSSLNPSGSLRFTRSALTRKFLAALQVSEPEAAFVGCLARKGGDCGLWRYIRLSGCTRYRPTIGYRQPRGCLSRFKRTLSEISMSRITSGRRRINPGRVRLSIFGQQAG